MLRISLLYCQLYTREEGRFFFNFRLADTALAESLFSRFVDKTNSNIALRVFRHFFSASIREGHLALSVGQPRETHSRYVIGICLIPLGIYCPKNSSRGITYVIGCIWGMPSLSPLSSLVLIVIFSNSYL